MMIHDKLLIACGDESGESTVETAALPSFDRDCGKKLQYTASMCHPTRVCLSRCGWVVGGGLLLWWWWWVGGWFFCVVCVCVFVVVVWMEVVGMVVSCVVCGDFELCLCLIVLCGKHSQVESVAGAAHLPNEQLSNQLSVSILAQAISRSNVRCVCPASRAFLVLSCPSVCNPVLQFLHILMARVDDGSDVPISLLTASSLNVGFLVGKTPDLEGTGIRSLTMEEKIKEMS